MCLILFSYKAHKEYKLIVAANRDEFYERPTEPASFWQDHPGILAGRDLDGGGTWMGVSRSGRLAMLTNYRDLSDLKHNAPTRGKLVSDFLASSPKPETYLDAIDTMASKYNGYNLVLGSHEDLWYYSNVERRKYMLGSGVYGLSNHLLDTPWPKVTQGKARFMEVISEGRIDPKDLLQVLYNEEMAADADLPNTGVGLETEKMLSPMFIKSPKYGSRCSTVLMIDNDNQAKFVERTYEMEAFDYSDKEYEFEINLSYNKHPH